MAADGKTPPTHPQGGGGNIVCTCSIFVCRHKNNDMSTLLGHVHTYIPTDRQTDTQAYIHKSIQTYSYTYTWLHMCDVSPLWGGGGGEPGGAGSYIYKYIQFYAGDSGGFLLKYSFVMYIHIHQDVFFIWRMQKKHQNWEEKQLNTLRHVLTKRCRNCSPTYFSCSKKGGISLR